MAYFHEWFYGDATALLANAQIDMRNNCYDWRKFDKNYNDIFAARQAAFIDLDRSKPAIARYSDSYWSPMHQVGEILWAAHVIAVARSSAYSSTSSIVLAAAEAAGASESSTEVEVLINAQYSNTYSPFEEVLLELCGDIIPTTAGTWTSHSGHTVTDLLTGDLVTSLKSEFFDEIKYFDAYSSNDEEGYWISHSDEFKNALHQFFRFYKTFKVVEFANVI